jgi:hypothetical protein
VNSGAPPAAARRHRILNTRTQGPIGPWCRRLMPLVQTLLMSVCVQTVRCGYSAPNEYCHRPVCDHLAPPASRASEVMHPRCRQVFPSQEGQRYSSRRTYGVAIGTSRPAARSSRSRPSTVSSTLFSNSILIIPPRSEWIAVPFFERMQTRSLPKRP